MRVSIVRGIEATFFAVIFMLVIAFITMAVAGPGSDAPAKPTSLAEWDQKESEEAKEAAGMVFTPSEQLEGLGFEPPYMENALKPRETAFSSRKADNLLNLLHYYYFLDEGRMLTESVEYVARDTGYIKIGDRGDVNYQLSHTGKHVKYLLALVKYHKLHPTIVVFDEDYDRMNALVKDIFESHPPNVVYGEETFFDLVELYELTGEGRYLDYTDYINQAGGWEIVAEARALMEQNRVPRPLTPIFMSSVLILQHYAERGKPLHVQTARLLYDGIIKACYNDNYKMFYLKATYNRPGNMGLQAIQQFKAGDLAVALLGMMKYYDATGDEEILAFVDEIIKPIGNWESDLIDRENILFYTKYLDKGSAYKDEDKRADVNLLLYSAIHRYLKYDTEYEDLVDSLKYLIDNIIYSSEYNGFFSRYDSTWKPVEEDGIYQLSLTDAILGAQIFLNNEEITRGLSLTASE